MYESHENYIERTTHEYIIRKGKDEALKFFEEMVQSLTDKINKLEFCDNEFIDDCQQGIYIWEQRKIWLLKNIK